MNGVPAPTPLQAAFGAFVRTLEFARESLDESEHDTLVDILTALVARLNADRITCGDDEC